MQQPEAAAAAPQSPAEGGGEAAEAPPKQVALAMERLARAARLIADIRLGGDQLLEALFVAADAPHQSPKIVQLILKEEAAMRRHFHDLHTLGRQLEESGILNGLIRSRGNSWGLNIPLVCPDGAVVAYAWKRQLAGQAGASAVDRTRLALKAFSDQKRRFFPHLEDEPFGQPCGGGVAKRHCSSRLLSMNLEDECKEAKSLAETLIDLEREAPNMKVFTYKRLDWLKRASSLSSSVNESSVDPKEQSFRSPNKSRPSSLSVAGADLVAVIELLVPSVFRAVISLHPAGSINPDTVAFFSPDEGGDYVHARGFSAYHVFKHITEHADKALQYFLSKEMHISLSLLLDWIYSYQTLFTKACSKCSRLLMMDKSLALLLPPVYRPFRRLSATKLNPTQQTLSTKGQTDHTAAYHIGCYSDELN